jgi:hypothetical protein
MSTAAGLVDEPPPFEIKLSHDAPDESAPSVEPEPSIAAKPRRARRPKVAPADPLTGYSSNDIHADATLTEQDPPSVVANDPPPVASTPGIAASTEPSWISSPLDAGDSPTPAVANGAPRRRSRARAASQGAESP